VGTLVTAALRPVLGRYGAYNALITLQLFADLVAVWLLVDWSCVWDKQSR
jgi:hypothetical protein